MMAYSKLPLEVGDTMIDAVIFDMDGLMLDTQRVWDEAIMTVVERNGDTPPEGFINDMRGTSLEYCLKVVAAWLGSEKVAMKYIKEVWAEAEAAFEKGVYKKPGLDELLTWLKEHNVRMAVASGSKMEWIEHHLKLAEVYDYFDAFLSGFEVEHAKPAPDVFLATAAKLGCDPANTVVLEDSENGIQAAAAGGFIPIMVPDVKQPEDGIRALCIAVCETLFDVIPLLEAEL